MKRWLYVFGALLLCFVTACAARVVCGGPPLGQIEAPKDTIADQINAAWYQVENENIVQYFEKDVPVDHWKVVNQFVLLDTYEYSDYISSRKFSSMFTKVAISKDGRVFLDQAERLFNNTHKERLVKFYWAIIKRK